MESLVDEYQHDQLNHPNHFVPEETLHPFSRKHGSGPHIDGMDDYWQKYKESVENPDKFWRDVAHDFYWHENTDNMNRKSVFEYNFDVRNGPVFTRFMAGAKTNLSYNALDRNVERGLGNKIAFHWEGNNIGDEGKVTYSQLLSDVSRFANALKATGLKKGDRVAIYLPMILELPIAMLACARIGVIHSVVFGGFSADSLAERMIDGKCSVLVTADGVWRGNKFINLKEIADEACAKCEDHGHRITRKFVIRHMGPVKSASNQLGNGSENGLHHLKNLGAGDQRRGSLCTKVRQDALDIAWDDAIDRWWHEELHRASDNCPVEWMDAEDPLFILYTSGSTGKPKGVLHTTAGYMVYAAFTFRCVFDYEEDDVYWCTADAGWITGHSYLVYGPLINGVTGIVFEGIPTHPEPDRYWKIIEKYRVTKFYTAPTAIRSLMKFGEDLVLKHDRSSLKILGTVGEPINPEAWLWYHKYVGNSQCAIVDTYWQTETGGHVITPLPRATPLEPGSATLPFFGVVPAVLDEDGNEIEEPDCEGYLVFKTPWPGLMRTVYGNHELYEKVYFKKFPGYYTTGDGCKRDKNGYYWITGRIDDMVNVSGHLLSTAEIESALVEHPSVAEAAVVSHPHAIKGECTYGFVTLKVDHVFDQKTVNELKLKVREKIGAFAVPDFLQDAPGLPKTRSGKIMRRVLRKIARGDRNLGDTSTLADPTVIDLLFSLRPPNA